MVADSKLNDWDKWTNQKIRRSQQRREGSNEDRGGGGRVLCKCFDILVPGKHLYLETVFYFSSQYITVFPMINFDMILSMTFQALLEELIMSGRYDTRDDFTVVYQPYLVNTRFPLLDVRE